MKEEEEWQEGKRDRGQVKMILRCEKESGVRKDIEEERKDRVTQMCGRTCQVCIEEERRIETEYRSLVCLKRESEKVWRLNYKIEAVTKMCEGILF